MWKLLIKDRREKNMLVRIDKDDLPLGCYQTEESVIELINLLNERDIFHVHTYLLTNVLH